MKEAGISESTLYMLANEGQLHGYRRISTRFLIHRQVFEQWLKSGMGDGPASWGFVDPE